jgi:hypothetical protein
VYGQPEVPFLRVFKSICGDGPAKKVLFLLWMPREEKGVQKCPVLLPPVPSAETALFRPMQGGSLILLQGDEE